MRGRPSFAQDVMRSVLALSILFYPVLSLAQDPGKTPAGGEGQTPSADAKAPVTTTSTQNGQNGTGTPPGNGGSQTTFTVVVHLRVDGNLAGRVSVLTPDGKRVPARAHVSFLQSGQIRGAADTDEQGRFQVNGLQPGVYSVLASGPDGFAAVSVQVLPYSPDAPKERLTLDLTLVPPGDDLSDLLAQAPVGVPIGSQGVPMSGGGGSGGGGGWGLLGVALGAAGLGLGIGALANEEASPYKP